MTATIVVCASGAAEASATLALNLALALSAIDLRVELRDAQPEAPLARALLGGAAPSRSPSGVQMAIVAGRGLRIEARPLGALADATQPSFEPDVVVVEEPTADAAEAGAASALRSADLVVIPVSTAPGRIDALPGLLAALGHEPPRVRLVLPRALSRQVDRWRLVEDLDARFPGALYGVTVPLGRSGVTRGESGAPTLYAPTGSAGRAYRVLARLLADDLSLRTAPRQDESERQGPGVA